MERPGQTITATTTLVEEVVVNPGHKITRTVAGTVSVGTDLVEGGVTRNDLNDGLRASNIVIVVRGTVELGNLGSNVGKPLVNQLSAELSGRVIFQGVDYPGAVTGYVLQGSPIGTAKMVQHIKQGIRECPESRIFLVGYSQGAQIVHNALDEISPPDAEHIGGIVVFGDPYHPNSVQAKPFPSSLQNKVLSIANHGDMITKGIADPTGAHLDYTRRVPEAVAWIKDRAL